MRGAWKSGAAVVLVVLIAAVAGGARAATPPVDVATQLLDRLEAGQYDAAESAFDSTMQQAVPADRLAGVWKSLPPARGRGTPQVQPVDGGTLVAIPLHRDGAELIAQVVVGPDGRITGFLVRPAPPPAAAAPAADAPYVERETQVGTGERALPATLTLPRRTGPFPAVVLVHGSGPQDRDETIGANRPFLDLARGLAARGIAVLRYEKRTHARPGDFAGRDFTVDDETTDDAVAAIATLRTQPGIDASRLFVFGHSQGAMLAPRIAARSGHVAGVVMLAAPARRLLDLLPEQNRYLFELDGTLGDDEKAALQRIDSMIATVRRGGPLAAADAPLGLPVAYWRSIDAVDPVADARGLALPMLLLQGGRDFQVTASDWSLWTSALGATPRAALKFYPALNHLAIAGSGPSTLQDYQVPGHVDAGLIGDVASWISAQPRTPAPAPAR
ncbi:alpha/beta hydrolase [Cognatilysobacter segetis]|uniref:alpha/beta hydrolase n=1 Tax=Cognatilysobacter segetis TaxID=2492394 RepID=UPI00105D5BE0|nr:alpha/beta fold hydrolase [Lysobacter segetis]